MNVLRYRMLSDVIICRSCTLFKIVYFFGLPCICTDITDSEMPRASREKYLKVTIGDSTEHLPPLNCFRIKIIGEGLNLRCSKGGVEMLSPIN